jgi:hypothetical protein
MKKRNLNSLKLNKKSISRLQIKDLSGGNGGSWLFPGCDTHPRICYTDFCPSYPVCYTTDPGEMGPCPVSEK